MESKEPRAAQPRSKYMNEIMPIRLIIDISHRRSNYSLRINTGTAIPCCICNNINAALSSASRLGFSRLATTSRNNNNNEDLEQEEEHQIEQNANPNQQHKRNRPGFWEDLRGQRQFLDSLAKRLGIQQPEQWYRVRTSDIVRFGGRGLLSHYNNSFIRALSVVYPEIEWQPWRFSSVPKHFWRAKANHRKFFDWVATQLDIQQYDQWYRVQKDDIQKLGGRGLLVHYYDDSLSKALPAVYPEFNWQPWLFESGVPRRFLSSTETVPSPSSSSSDPPLDGPDSSSSSSPQPKMSRNETTLRDYIEYLSGQLGIQHLDDWHRVSQDQIRGMRGFALIQRNGGLLAVLKRLYPGHFWDEEQFRLGKGKKSTQRWLRVILSKLFPDHEILEEYSHHGVRLGDDNTQDFVQLDLWIPSLSLAFEYQGQQHYHDLLFFNNTDQLKRRDTEKALACQRVGITLIPVPYWWDRGQDSLAATIRKYRPDLLAHMNSSDVSPIPDQPQKRV